MKSRHCSAALILGAVLCASAAAQAAGVDPTTATQPQKEQAQEHFSKAHDSFERKQFSPALDEARASWNVVASPNARILIARCLRETGKLAEAYSEYSATIDDASALATKEARYADTAKAATEERTALEPKLALVTLQIDHASDDTRVTVGGQTVAKDTWSRPLPETPGSVDVVVEAGGKQVARQSLTLGAGDKKSVALDANPGPRATIADPSDNPDFGAETKTEVAPTTASGGGTPLRTAAYVAGGVGAVGLVLFGVFGALDDSTYSSLKSACPGGACPPAKAGDISSGKTQQLVANVGLGVGIAGVAAGVTLFVVSLRGKPSAPPKADTTTTSLVVSPSFIGLRGTL